MIFNMAKQNINGSTKTFKIKMKRLTTFAVLLIGLHHTQAQEYTLKPTTPLADTKLVIKNLSADIQIIGIDGSDIKVIATDYEGMPEKAKGLRPLSANGPENTGIGLNMTQTGNEIQISGASRDANDGEYVFKVPKAMKLYIEYMSWEAGDVIVTGMAGEVEAKSQVGDLVFKSVTGPIVANTLSSDIEVQFSSLSQASATSLNSTSGDIDVTMPATSKGKFNMGSISGEIYTDMDFKIASEEGLTRFGGGMKVDATLGDGGVDVSFRTISGDIYVRKSK